jgi:SAM-dependent methyltransferase
MMTDKKTDRCRISGEPLVELFSLGKLFITDFLAPEEILNEQDKIGLTLMLAPNSGLVQLKETTPPDSMYRRYWYRTGTNQTMRDEMKDIINTTTRLVPLKPKDVYVDIGCNDGTMLGILPKDIVTVGFDPAENGYKEIAEKEMTYFVNDYFSLNTYPIKEKAKIITCISMFYDLDDPNGFVKDIKEILDDDGLWVIQMNYLPLMLDFLAVDNISHEHLSYYSLSALKYLLDMNDMKIIDAKLDELNGGTFRVFAVKNSCDLTKIGTQPYRNVANTRVESLLAYEDTLNLKNPTTYKNFFSKISELKETTRSFIKTEISKGKSVGVYGASSRGNTMLQFFELDKSLIAFAAERATTKVGLRTVGTDIPIISEEEMRKAQPDYLLVLPYGFISEFVRREKDYLDKGGKFIVPCPKFEIIGN